MMICYVCVGQNLSAWTPCILLLEICLRFAKALLFMLCEYMSDWLNCRVTHGVYGVCLDGWEVKFVKMCHLALCWCTAANSVWRLPEKLIKFRSIRSKWQQFKLVSVMRAHTRPICYHVRIHRVHTPTHFVHTTVCEITWNWRALSMWSKNTQKRSKMQKIKNEHF